MNFKSKFIHLILFEIMFCINICGTTQNFYFDHEPDTMLLYFPPHGHLNTKIINTSQQSIEIDVIRLVNQMPNDSLHYWLSGMCFITCYPTIVDSFRVSLPPDTILNFRMGFLRFGAPSSDTAHTQILFRNVNDISNSFLQDYYATTDPIYLYSIDSMNSYFNFSIYPNPTESLLQISCSENSSSFILKVLDVHGRIYITRNVTDQNYMLDLSSLNSGIYFLVLDYANFNKVYTHRIVKN